MFFAHKQGGESKYYITKTSSPENSIRNTLRNKCATNISLDKGSNTIIKPKMYELWSSAEKMTNASVVIPPLCSSLD